MNEAFGSLAAVAASLLAGSGAWLIYSSRLGADQRRAGRVGRPVPADRGARLLGRPPWRSRGWRDWFGLGEVRASEFTAAVAVVAGTGGLGAYLLFGGVAPAILSALFAATFPVAGFRRRRQARHDAALAEWPRLLEEIRLRAGSLGRSVPQALFEAGRGVSADWRPAFEAAEREWLLTVDFARTVDMLKGELADATADVVCETLLMAHEIGGTDLDSKLVELIEDRTQDLQSRKDAESRLAGVRFARRFVLLVPLGMAAAGLTIGTGRQAYASAGGQVAVVIGLTAVALCWWWAGRLMRLPRSPRVFR